MCKPFHPSHHTLRTDVPSSPTCTLSLCLHPPLKILRSGLLFFTGPPTAVTFRTTISQTSRWNGRRMSQGHPQKPLLAALIEDIPFTLFLCCDADITTIRKTGTRLIFAQRIPYPSLLFRNATHPSHASKGDIWSQN